jgi:hypothetical protein
MAPNDDAPKRKKNPSYDVFCRKDIGWLEIAENVAASSRREAITKATADTGDPADQYGTFAVVRSGEFKVLTRTKKVIEAEDWS